MKRKKDVVCPNCFGKSFSEVLITEISRNTTPDDSPPALRGAGVSSKKLRQAVKILCTRCCNELNPYGGRP